MFAAARAAPRFLHVAADRVAEFLDLAREFLHLLAKFADIACIRTGAGSGLRPRAAGRDRGRPAERRRARRSLSLGRARTEFFTARAVMRFLQHLLDPLRHRAEAGGPEVLQRLADVFGTFPRIHLRLTGVTRGMAVVESFSHLAGVLALIILRAGALALDIAGVLRRGRWRRRNVWSLGTGGDACGDGKDRKEDLCFHGSIETRPEPVVAKFSLNPVP